MGADKYLEATKPVEREIQGPNGEVIKATGFVNPYTGVFVKSSEYAPPQKWIAEKDKAGNLLGYRSETGTQFLNPEEFQARGTPAAAPVSRGQAGAFEPTATAGAPAMAPAGPIADMVNQARPGVSRVESGSAQGNYLAKGPEVKRKDGSVDRAYGKYQVMGANIPSWTEQALGKRMSIQEFLASPEAQEKVFEDQFTRNIKKYGSLEDAVSVWFSGRPLAQATKAGARDVNMGVPEYVQKVMGGLGKYQTAKTVPLTGENPSLRNVPVNAFAPSPAPVNAFAAPAQQPIEIGRAHV